MGKIAFLVRHGQTVGNVIGITQGPDDPLNETGIRQAKIIAERARGLDFDCIISSDYPRARITAEKIQLATRKPLILSDLFREFRRPSEFWNRVVQENQDMFDGYMLINEHFTDEDWHYSDEENFFDLKKRGIAALNYLLQRQEEKVFVVTHGNFLRNLLGIILRGEDAYAPQDYLDIEMTFELDNTSITVAKYQPHWRKSTDTWMIGSWNDCAHLGEI